MADMSSPAGTRADRLGQRIRDFRKARGYTIESFAHALGWSWITISRYERGQSSPDIARLHEMADLLDISIGELVSEDNAEPDAIPAKATPGSDNEGA